MSRVDVDRVYHTHTAADGRRVLVDRLWPRGVSKADAALDDHVPDVAPSTELRHWYGHDPARFAEFRDRYLAELEAEPAASALEELVTQARAARLILLTATRDVEHSHASVLADRIRAQL